MFFSDVHKAYGDDSVYQVLAGCSHNVPNGDDTTRWSSFGYDMIRAVKCFDGDYVFVIRQDDGLLMYESHESYKDPMAALEAGKQHYTKRFSKGVT